MTKPCSISVVIPCFNHGEFLAEAVTSVTNTKRQDVELIIVDDGSTDQRTRKEVDVFVDQGIKVVRQENRGLAAARNAGILVSEGKYILPLDADNRVRLGYIEHGIRILDGNPEVGVVYGDAEYIGMRSGRWRVGSFKRDQLLKWNYIDACAVYRRTVWEQNHGYDDTMPIQGLEDWDFWLGALENGWQFVYLPEILFDYRVSAHSMITRTHGFEVQIENFIAKKHGLLYRRTWLQESESVRASFRNLCRLFLSRFKRNF
jgi:glycosyltransferase involved in cell wall biosynthesis